MAMPETLVQEQARTKPKVEDIIPLYLDGESRKSLVGFMEFCLSENIRCKWSATNRWKIVYKGESLGMLYIGSSPCMGAGKHYDKNIWYTHINSFPYLGEQVIDSEKLAEVIYRNVLPCQRGSKSCSKSDTVIIYGKAFEDVCPNSGSRFANPDAETMDYIKRSLEFRVKQISMEKAK